MPLCYKYTEQVHLPRLTEKSLYPTISSLPSSFSIILIISDITNHRSGYHRYIHRRSLCSLLPRYFYFIYRLIRKRHSATDVAKHKPSVRLHVPHAVQRDFRVEVRRVLR